MRVQDSSKPLTVREMTLEAGASLAAVAGVLHRRDDRQSDTDRPVKARAAINDLVDSSTMPVTLVPDVPCSPRHDDVGLDNIALGRSGGARVSRFVRLPQSAILVDDLTNAVPEARAAVVYCRRLPAASRFRVNRNDGSIS